MHLPVWDIVSRFPSTANEADDADVLCSVILFRRSTARPVSWSEMVEGLETVHSKQDEFHVDNVSNYLQRDLWVERILNLLGDLLNWSLPSNVTYKTIQVFFKHGQRQNLWVSVVYANRWIWWIMTFHKVKIWVWRNHCDQMHPISERINNNRRGLNINKTEYWIHVDLICIRSCVQIC